MGVRGAWMWLVAGSVLAACNFDGGASDCEENPLRCFDGGAPAEQGAIGKPCESAEQCLNALRLSCVQGSCAFAEDLAENDPCTATLECADGLYCSVEDGRSVCDQAGSGGAGARCESSADCARNLVCTFDVGLAKHCVAAGQGDIGAACDGPSDCYAGLACTAPGEGRTRVCAMQPEGAQPLVPWQGAGCPEDAPQAVAYFEVPRPGVSGHDFFRLPFPNDVRRVGDRLDLTGFPSPGDLFGTGLDLVGSYVRASEQPGEGFATNPVVYFRFSRPYAGVAKESVLLVDIDPDSPTYGRPLSRNWGTSAGDVTEYVCENWLNVRTPTGAPLRAGTTYAVILTRAIAPRAGGTFARDADFEALLNGTAPSDAALASAHRAYAPLRAFLGDAKNELVAADQVLNAAVFTTLDPLAVVRATREVVRAGDPPTVKDVTVCADGVTSPCDDGGERRCGPANAAFTEIHGRIALPIFQAGTAPYETRGGGFEVVDGKPRLQKLEDVCFGLSVPTGDAPAGGFPVVLYGHGTGGSFKSGLDDLAEVAARAGAAVLSIDLPAHGSRKRGSARGSDELFFNFANPAAARDNVTQGAADLFSLAYFARTFSASADSQFGRAVAFDATRIVYVGHSQGATHGSLFAPFESDLRGAVLSGLGGDLGESLVSKRAPIDVAASLYLVLGDPSAAPTGEPCPALIDPSTGEPRTGSDGQVLRSQCLGANHPVYGLMQSYFERVDPVNFASLWRAPLPSAGGKHLFMVWGRADHYSPESTQGAYALAGGLALVAPALTPVGDAAPLPAPVSGNVKIGDVPFTQGVRQYDPASGEDGHFVYLGAARADRERFVKALLAGEPPSIGE